MSLVYDLDKIKFGVNQKSWEKAIDIYETGKISKFKEDPYQFIANVQGTKKYQVYVSKKNYKNAECTCYLGQHDTLCKHVIAVAIYAIKKGKNLTLKDKKQHNEVVFSGRKGTIDNDRLKAVKKEITQALRFVKAYNGPSRTWFNYQDTLQEGCNRMASILSDMPASKQTAELIIKTLLRLDKKLQIGGVDDSNGTVGGLISDGVDLLIEFSKIDPSCIKSFTLLKGIVTCFDWEDDLLILLEKTN